MTHPDEGTAVEAWIPSADDFGSRLALVRHRMGWNVKEAARECGVGAATWRDWEFAGALPRNLVTIAMTIATRTGCDYLWLVHGPNRGATIRRTAYIGQTVLAAIGAPKRDRPNHAQTASPHTRSVRQTRPTGRVAVRPRTPQPV